MLLPNDLSNFPSYGESIFTTVVHEFGHTLGLQHTQTSSVMSTLDTAGTSRAKPLAADDIAGISWLYPTGDFLSGTGTVSGTVAFSNGDAVNLAAVTVIAPGLEAISAFTNPDGTFIIHGVPPGQYYVYAQPLRPALEGEAGNDGVAYPLGPDGTTAIPPSGFFVAQFYPGVPYSAASPVNVSAGGSTDNINFSVTPESYPAVYAVRTYGFVPNGAAVASPPVIPGITQTIEASGAGLLQAGNMVVSGLGFEVVGSVARFVANSLRPYPPPNTYGYLAFDLDVSSQAPLGPGHLLISTPSDLYVLPAAFHVVTSGPPILDGVDTFAPRVLAIPRPPPVKGHPHLL